MKKKKEVYLVCNCFKCISLHNCDKADKYRTDFEKRMLACKKCNVHSDCELCKYSVMHVNGLLICSNSEAWRVKNAETEV